MRDHSPLGGKAYRRRDALSLAGLAGLAAGLAVVGCGSQPAPPPAPAPQPSVPPGSAAFWASQRKHGHVNFANWPYYIDPSHRELGGCHPHLVGPSRGVAALARLCLLLGS